VSTVTRLTQADAERLRIASPAHAPIVQAMKAGAMLLVIWQGQRIALPLRETARRPWIAIVGDDNEISYGPSAYDRDGLRRLAALARALVVYSGAAAVQHYGLFAATAVLGANVLVVETQLERHAEWSAFLRPEAPHAAYLDAARRNGMTASQDAARNYFARVYRLVRIPLGSKSR
jgi:hypothetical protein